MALQRILLTAAALLLATVVRTAGQTPVEAPPETARQSLQRLLETRLDPARCYRVRDLFLERGEVKFYLTDGVLIFASPFDGREVAAFFIATENTDHGELLAIPPNARERHSVALHTGEGVLNERFRSALMLFTDDTAEVLRRELEAGSTHKLDAELGATLAPRWSPVLKNVLEGVSLRLLADLLGGRPVAEGVFAAAVNGGRLGRFDVVIDPHLREQVSIGQSVRRDGRSYFDVWTQFESRQGAEPLGEINGSLEDYRIDVTLGPDLRLDAVVEAELSPGADAGRTFALELSQDLRLRALSVRGRPADYVQLEQSPGGQASRRQNNVVLLALPEPPPPGERIPLRFEYSGEAVSEVGEGVFMVLNRGDWYPRGEPSFTEYEMTFRHPAQYDLVATGEIVSESVDAGVRTVRFRSAHPIRLAGATIGDFVSASRQVDSYTVEIRANRKAEARLRPRAPLPVVVPSQMAGVRRRPTVSESAVVSPAEPPPPNPAARIQEIADADAESFAYFLERFGPPATPRVVITPIPAVFGQGFPGLVYSPTLSYFAPVDAPLKPLPPDDQQFFAELVRAHEISHQWWGNTVTVLSGADNWLMEGLATYSSMLILERRQGPAAFQRLMAGFRLRLLMKNEQGLPLDSAGPVTLGERLHTARFPGAYRVVLYEKSAWILHMLRARLGDDAFFALLSKLVRDYRLQAITTEAFRSEAAALLPPGDPDPELREFFEQWAYETGIPRLRVRHEQKGGALTGQLLLDGVSEAFLTPVELELTLDAGARQRLTVWTDGAETNFEAKAPSKIQRIVIDPDAKLLAVRE